MKRAVLIFCLIIIGITAFAENADNNKEKASTKLISGKVIDKISGEEIAGAVVKIGDKIIYTDLNGKFSAIIKSSETEAIISFVSYNEMKVNIEPFSYSEIVVQLESK